VPRQGKGRLKQRAYVLPRARTGCKLCAGKPWHSPGERIRVGTVLATLRCRVGCRGTGSITTMAKVRPRIRLHTVSPPGVSIWKISSGPGGH